LGSPGSGSSASLSLISKFFRLLSLWKLYLLKNSQLRITVYLFILYFTCR
jgi:hypothetical protein